MAENDSELITILVAEPDPLTHRGLRDELLEDGRFAVVDCVPGDVLQAAGREQPDVIVVDPSAGDSMDGALLTALRQAAPSSRIVILSRLCDPNAMQVAMAAGVRGYLLKGRTLKPEGALRAMQTIGLDGRYVFDPEVVDYLSTFAAAAPPAREAGDRLQSLTDREREILVLLGRDVTDQLIALSCEISEPTVRAHVRALRAKLGIDTRAGLGSFAQEQGLVGPE